MADLLGTDHYLAVLEDLARNECKKSCDAEEAELLYALVNQRRMELENEAVIIGPKLFAETPKQFSQRLKGYWKSWKHDQNLTVAA